MIPVSLYGANDLLRNSVSSLGGNISDFGEQERGIPAAERLRTEPRRVNPTDYNGGRSLITQLPGFRTEEKRHMKRRFFRG
ncbi:hypothetical protein GDO78_018511 [Eleutherodactylus coqui]|uniref:Uncharacterized protein n=1 Tax=Eleutherodactylus coqui TaxID=57060 RepID=A0A8J6AZG0_ELECQ|nr:hypothetical protein GDO78_018511 [Eleutherodactylus coqui]